MDPISLRKTRTKRTIFKVENILWENAQHNFKRSLCDDLMDPVELNFNGAIKVYFNGQMKPHDIFCLTF